MAEVLYNRSAGVRVYRGNGFNTANPRAPSIRDPETDRLARELAALTGETMTQAIRKAIEQRLERERCEREAAMEEKKEKIMGILERIWAMPVIDDRSADEIPGYDEHGLPS